MFDRDLTDWACLATAPGAVDGPGGAALDDADWLVLSVPGTAAGALLTASLPIGDLDQADWWFRTSFTHPGDGSWDLVLEGVATIADVWVNGVLLAHTVNMFRCYRLPLGTDLGDQTEVLLRCAALSPLLAARRRPRPRWKAHLPADQALRWFRTSLIGRSPSWTPDVAPVGPWRPVSLRRRPTIDVERRRFGSHHDGVNGSITASFAVRPAAPTTSLTATLVVGEQRAQLQISRSDDGFTAAGSLLATGADPWWPATHGSPTLYPARLEVTADGDTQTIDLGRVGYRSVSFQRDDAPVLRVNGVDVFCRGVCWTPPDVIGLGSDPAELRTMLEQVRSAGFNLVRVQGSMVYETDRFHELCDELGLLVWQDLMFATLDYPVDDEDFCEEVASEVTELCRRLQVHPSTAVVCGGSEVFQQSAMVGQFDPAQPDRLFGELLSALIAEQMPDVAYWPNSPDWTADSFSVDTGIAHYFGVGGYQRPLSDARTSGVRFASECLAFSCVPGDRTIADMAGKGQTVGTASWKAGVPRDAGQAWDFEDVRDHYVAERFGVDPSRIRAVDPEHYLDLGRAAVAEVMAATFAEWRRPRSVCAGGIILSLRDLVDGAGFGLIDAYGRPKSTWFALRRVLQPVAVIFCDEGLNGLDVHLLNDGPDEIVGMLGITAHVGPNLVAAGELDCRVAPRSARSVRVEALLGGFRDIGWAYRFGPQSIDCVAATWHPEGGPSVHAVHLPGGAPMVRGDVGLAATFEILADGRTELAITTAAPARCIFIETLGQPSDDAFDLEPGRTTSVVLTDPGSRPISVRSVNGTGSVTALPLTH